VLQATLEAVVLGRSGSSCIQHRQVASGDSGTIGGMSISTIRRPRIVKPTAEEGSPRGLVVTSPAPPVLLAPAPLRLSDRATSRVLGVRIAHRDEPLVRSVGTDLSAKALNQLLDLLGEPIHTRPPPLRQRQPAACALPRRVLPGRSARSSSP